MADIKYDIIKEIGVLSKNAKGWQKELNLISWNGGAAKYDIRDWAPDHEKMGKGITLSAEEAGRLKEVLNLVSKQCLMEQECETGAFQYTGGMAGYGCKARLYGGIVWEDAGENVKSCKDL